MSVRPLGKFILATPVEEENNQTKSGHKTEYEIDGEKFIFVSAESIIAVVNKKKEEVN